MPWKETYPMIERRLFVKRANLDEISFSQLCHEFGISRKTGYKLLARYKEDPVNGLVDRRTTRIFPTRYPAEIFESILAFKLQKPVCGPKKIHKILSLLEPHRQWPSPSTIKLFLKKMGLVKKQHKRRSCPVKRQKVKLREVTRPKEVWSSDFKGWFLTGDGSPCEPLTMLDNHSRFLITCKITLSRKFSALKHIFETAFNEYGCPDAIRTDSGPPFGSRGLGRLSPLSVWLLKLGIYPEKIRPGHPEDNGRIERFHRTLKAEAISPSAQTLAAQQQRFEAFREEYNTLRPHEALNQEPPSHHYHPEHKVPCPNYEYPETMTVVKVNAKGYGEIGGKVHYLSGSLAHEYIGYTQDDEGYHLEFLGYPLGAIQEKNT